MSYYILADKKPVLITDLMTWAESFEKSNKVVAKTHIGHILVSTVFLGLDHSFGGQIPILFETMIFGGKHDRYQERYATWKSAERGHEKAVALVRSHKEA